MNSKKDIYRNYGVWIILILFYVVFYYLSNHAWIEKIDLKSDVSVTSSYLYPTSIHIPDDDSTVNETIFIKDDTVNPPTIINKSNSSKSTSISPYHKNYQKKEIFINRADQQEWQSLYNIGPYRADKIINFRRALGGFYSIDQIGETYGIPDSVFQEIKQQLRLDNIIQKIEINKISYDSLYKHPYITKQMAYFIVKYREDTKYIEQMDDLYNVIKEKDHERLRKLEPYLDFSIR